jgi:hypothetical protein
VEISQENKKHWNLPFSQILLLKKMKQLKRRRRRRSILLYFSQILEFCFSTFGD